MIEFSESTITGVAVHKVGNKSREEGVKASNEMLELYDELEEVLYRYFTKPFLNVEDTYCFSHEADLSMNEMYNFCKSIFEHPSGLLVQSIHMLKHLYAQSQHPHIKGGEFYVVHFKDIVLEGELVNAVGIFKSEEKDTFLKIEEQAAQIQLESQKGINIKKLDKGCLVFNTEEDSGYRLMVVDANNYDAHYWKDAFLQVTPDKNEVFQTKNTIDMVKSFTNDVVSRQEDKKEQAMLLNRTVKYFQEQEQFDMDNFAEEVLIKPAYKEEFQDYKRIYAEKEGVETEPNFEIAPSAVKQAKRKIKSLIKLDTNVQIKLDFNDPDSADKFIVKGYNEVKEMHFYTIYFNHEKP